MRLCHQSLGAVFIDGRILVCDTVFEVFTPSCKVPWSPKEGQWTRVNFDWKPFRDGTVLINLSGTIYSLIELFYIMSHYRSSILAS